MSVRTLIKKKMRAVSKTANIGIVNSSKHVSTQAGVPSAAGFLSELNYDSTNDDVYINTDAGTTWVKIVD